MCHFARQFALAAITLLIAGCDREFQQSVSFKVTESDGTPIQNVPLRYYSEGLCKGSFKAAVTSDTGEATVTRQSIKGGVGVLLEEPSLCFESKGKWYAAWQEFIDPVEVERFSCVMQSAGLFICERLDPAGGI